jgi:hypothetical protein
LVRHIFSRLKESALRDLGLWKACRNISRDTIRP